MEATYSLIPIRLYIFPCSWILSLMYALYEQKLVYQVGAFPTKVVCLTQVVSADELKDDEEYEDIMEDMRLEAGKYGNLVKVVIPRPDPSGQPVAGVGKASLVLCYDLRPSQNFAETSPSY
jgi:splicing factor U2AF subunit